MILVLCLVSYNFDVREPREDSIEDANQRIHRKDNHRFRWKGVHQLKITTNREDGFINSSAVTKFAKLRRNNRDRENLEIVSMQYQQYIQFLILLAWAGRRRWTGLSDSLNTILLVISNILLQFLLNPLSELSNVVLI